MKNISLCFTVVFVLALFASCEKELEYRGEYVDPIITLTSFNDIYDTLYCNISKTNFFLEDNAVWIIDNPSVRYSVNGGEWQDMVSAGVSETGYSEQFISNYVIQSNDEVALEVSHPDYPTATSTQNAPVPAKITVEKLEKVTPYIYSATATFYPYEGETDEELLYQFSITYVFTMEALDHPLQWTDSRYLHMFTSNDPLTLNAYGDDDSFFTSNIGEGDTVLYFYASLITEPYEFTFEIDISEDHEGYYDWENWDYRVDKVEAYLAVVPESYFKYIDTKYSSLYESMFSEKVQLYNNIEGGVGNFIIRSHAVDSLSIGE